MLYSLIKLPASCALWIYCKCLRVNKKDIFNSHGPLILACNHPNSFLDAVILATLFKRPVYSLARGDAFNKNWVAFLLRSINIYPVYRQSEGAEHLHRNYDTFDICQHLFRKNGIVLVFTEALCEHEWHLRPLKKGTARLAINAWQENIPLKVLPVGINYNSFDSFGKIIHLGFGEMITQQDLHTPTTDHARMLNELTNRIKIQLAQLVYEIKPDDKTALQKIFSCPVPLWKRVALFLPAVCGWLLHAPLYLPIKLKVSKAASQDVHYDSIMVGALFITYPFYLALISLLTYFISGGWWWVLVFPLMPFLAWSYVQVKKK